MFSINCQTRGGSLPTALTVCRGQNKNLWWGVGNLTKREWRETTECRTARFWRASSTFISTSFSSLILRFYWWLGWGSRRTMITSRSVPNNFVPNPKWILRRKSTSLSDRSAPLAHPSPAVNSAPSTTISMNVTTRPWCGRLRPRRRNKFTQQGGGSVINGWLKSNDSGA